MNAAAVQVACVIPAFRQPGLLAEALESVMAQTLPGVAAIVVDDGCPMPETREVALEAASRHPGRVHALHTRNGGLSAARNRGIDHALAAFPQARGIYMLDADNRILPRFLERGLALLDAAPPQTGWFYPDIDSLGVWDCTDASGEFSPLSLLLDNYCEAGSLLRRSMLDTGLRYDTTLRQGWEDVEFWLQCMEAGFSGQHLPDAGFRYRRRAESMLAESDRITPQLRAAMQLRHPRLYHPRAIMAREAIEAPRHALLTMDDPVVRILHDPQSAGRGIDRAAWRAEMWEAFANPPARHYPYATILAAPGTLRALEEQRLLPWAFWFATLALHRKPVAGLVLHRGLAPRVTLAHSAAAVDGAHILFIRTGEWLRDVALHPGQAARWMAGLLGPATATRIDIEIPTAEAARRAAPFGRPAGELLAESEALAMARPAAPPPPWRRPWAMSRDQTARYVLARQNIGLTMPVARAGRNIGIIQPLHSQGGVERVLLQQAMVLRDAGWTPHLFVTQAADIAMLPGITEAYGSINLLQVTGQEHWPDPPRAYFGAETSGFGQIEASADALGALLGMDAVLNTHALAGHALANRLRRAGIPTLLGLHLTERGPFGEPVGPPHTALAYEYAYDMALVISEKLRAWCIAQGWPAEKLMLVRNAPGYASTAPTIRAPSHGRRLRALFLGRLDAQKGLERLAATIRLTAGWIDWRVAGKPVLGGPPPALGLAIEPPAEDGAALDALYAWADVLLLPSRFEGVPLTILEAQRLGCVPIATDVGAVAEIIAHGRDGWLLDDADDQAVAEAAAAALRQLDTDRAMLADMAARAAQRLATARWEDTMQPLLQWLDAGVPS